MLKKMSVVIAVLLATGIGAMRLVSQPSATSSPSTPRPSSSPISPPSLKGVSAANLLSSQIVLSPATGTQAGLSPEQAVAQAQQQFPGRSVWDAQLLHVRDGHSKLGSDAWVISMSAGDAQSGPPGAPHHGVSTFMLVLLDPVSGHLIYGVEGS